MTKNIPAWLASEIELREAESYVGVTISRTIDEHLAHEASCVSYVNGMRTVVCVCAV